MHLINRAALIVRPKQPFIDWASTTDYEAGLSEQFLKDEFQIYLVPEDPKGESVIPPLDNVFEEIFIDQLFGWDTDDSSWPDPITLELFHAWFDVLGNSMVMDVGNTSIYRERLDKVTTDWKFSDFCGIDQNRVEYTELCGITRQLCFIYPK